jgi:diaminopimelate epimerase
MLSFSKYQGTGNDFIMIDNRDKLFEKSKEEIAFLCDRRFGIGADGLILIESQSDFDFKMKYFNADGNEGSMCGNGGRCAVKFASDLGIFSKKTTFVAIDGVHFASIEKNEVSLGMIDTNEIQEVKDGFFLNTGSPHLVIIVEDVNIVDVKNYGSSIRYSDFWMEKGGVNVNFVQKNGEDSIFVRTYERGVEDETFSCGTGVTASALIASQILAIKSPCIVQTLGGKLGVSFSIENNNKFKEIILKGPAKFVFSGQI